MKHTATRSSFLIQAARLVLVALALPVSAAPTAWRNSGTDFNNAANWTNGLPAKANVPGDVGIFSGTPSAQPVLGATGGNGDASLHLTLPCNWGQRGRIFRATGTHLYI